jgi:hypothetical protein
VVLPAVAETLDPSHKPGRGILWRGQQWLIPKVSVYFVIDSVRKLLDTTSYLQTKFHSPKCNGQSDVPREGSNHSQPSQDQRTADPTLQSVEPTNKMALITFMTTTFCVSISNQVSVSSLSHSENTDSWFTLNTLLGHGRRAHLYAPGATAPLALN